MQTFQFYHFNEPIQRGIDKESSVLSNVSCNFWAQLSSLKAIYDCQLRVQASQELSSKWSSKRFKIVILKHFLFSFHWLPTLSQDFKDFKISNFCAQLTKCNKVKQHKRKHHNVFHILFSIISKNITNRKQALNNLTITIEIIIPDSNVNSSFNWTKQKGFVLN